MRNPEKLKSKCIPVLEAQEYIAVSRLPCVSTPRRSWCSVLIFQAPRVLFFCFVFLLVLCLLFGLFAFL